MDVLGIDIGGSAVKGAPVNTRTGRMRAERHRLPVSADTTPREVAARVAEIAAFFRWRGPIGIGFPGVIADTRIRTSANLHPRFVGCDGVKLFAGATGRPVALLNDAAAAGLAEMTFGAGRGRADKALLLTLGTGVGSALVLDGVVFPVELGHLPLKGRSAEKRVSAAARKRHGLTWKEWARRLNEYLGILETIVRPELIVIGGGVSSKHAKFFPQLRTAARVVPARLGNEAGIVGAALYAAKHPK